MGTFTLHMTGLTGSPTQATVKLTLDADGDIPISQEATASILTGETTATEGGCVVTVNGPLRTDGLAFYVWVQLDTGSATSGQSFATWWR